jgi:hypothetical protein
MNSKPRYFVAPDELTILPIPSPVKVAISDYAIIIDIPLPCSARES